MVWCGVGWCGVSFTFLQQMASAQGCRVVWCLKCWDAGRVVLAGWVMHGVATACCEATKCVEVWTARVLCVCAGAVMFSVAERQPVWKPTMVETCLGIFRQCCIASCLPSAYLRLCCLHGVCWIRTGGASVVIQFKCWAPPNVHAGCQGSQFAVCDRVACCHDGWL
jgi:hypothetical protein